MINLDIIDSDEVDVVGDAHKLGEIFPANTFDAVICISTFEHLSQPHLLPNGINHVLKKNGHFLIHTHQTIGLHDEPWDYYRFSKYCWDVLFNLKSGFRVLKCNHTDPQIIIPKIFNFDHSYETNQGMTASSVVGKKIKSIKRTNEYIEIDSSYPTN